MIMPTRGYLEASDGPSPLSEVECVDISTIRIRGGIWGRPRKMIDIENELSSRLRATTAVWELRDGTWSIERIIDDEPLRMIRVLNPYGPAAGASP